MDDLETQRKFKAQIGAPFAMVADPEGKLVERYDVKVPLMPAAKRRTFVIAPDGKIVAIDEGSDAIDPQGALTALEKLTAAK